MNTCCRVPLTIMLFSFLFLTFSNSGLAQTSPLLEKYVDPLPALFPDGEYADISELMKFRVKTTASAPDSTTIPQKIVLITKLTRSSASRTRTLTLEEFVDENYEPIELKLDGKGWDEPVTETPKLDTKEIWE